MSNTYLMATGDEREHLRRLATQIEAHGRTLARVVQQHVTYDELRQRLSEVRGIANVMESQLKTLQEGRHA